MMSLKVWKMKRKCKDMTKILKKDIVRLCNCIQGLSYQHIKENEKGCYNHNIITWYNIKPYTCKEVSLLFYKDDYKIVLTADNKKEMYIKLLEVYENGLNSWIDTFEKDTYKTKKEKHRLNVHKKTIIRIEKGG
jgi:DNA-binding XRE family transcriptional regulator